MQHFRWKYVRSQKSLRLAGTTASQSGKFCKRTRNVVGRLFRGKDQGSAGASAHRVGAGLLEASPYPRRSVISYWCCSASIFLPVFCALTLFADETNFFLPKNPVAAAYVLGRLSNKELIEAPRSEFVYVALLQRKGLDRKYRVEALNGLAEVRHTDRSTQVLGAIKELDNKGADSKETLLELAPLLLEAPRGEILSHRAELDQLKVQAKLDTTRQIAFAACVTYDESPEPSWENTKTNPAQLADLVLSVPLLVDSALRAGFYDKIMPLGSQGDFPDLRRAAIRAMGAIPGHDEDRIKALAGLAEGGVEVPTVVASLEGVPRPAWPTNALKPLIDSLTSYLQNTPAEQRTESAFTSVLQFATDLASRLPADTQKTVTRILRGLGPTIVTLHAVYEQMRFDKDLIVVEAGKPLVLTLQNDDAMPHNLAVLSPGALKEIGLTAEKMPPEPDSEGRLYVPASPKVLQATRLVNPGQKAQLSFNSPTEDGEYPFVCTFPGHWLRMAGTLVVTHDMEAYLASHAATQEPKLTEWKLSDFSADLLRAEVGRNLETGRELFSRLACVQCHKLGSSGYAYGPDLTEVLQKYKGDRTAVLQQILEPSKVIEDRYRNIRFDLKNGDPLLGIVLKEDDQNVTIQTGPADSLIQTVKKSEIQQRRAQTSSPMPVGLLRALSKPEILDLLAYLESGGKVLSHEHHHP